MGVPTQASPRRPSLLRAWPRWWLSRSVLTKGLIALIIPLLALVTVTVAAFVLQAQERTDRSIAAVATNLSMATLAVLADAVDAETGVRGYVGTSDPLFLPPYTAATMRLQADLARAKDNVTTPQEAQQFALVAGTATEVFRELAALRAKAQSGSTAAQLVPDLQSSKLVMDRLRVEVADLAASPGELLAQKAARVTQLQTAIELVEIAGLVLGALTGVAGVALFTTGISRRVRLAAENAKRLGSGDDLVPAPEASDELGRLNESLDQAHRLLATRLADLRVARDVAVHATEAKNTFLSRTSHELRTPLNAVLGFAQLLQLSDIGPEDKDSASRIVGAGRHLLALINELIDTAQIEAGQLKLSVESVGVREVMEEVAGLMGPLARARDITIEHGYDDSGAGVLADRQRLRQVLVNLVSNAIKYNRHGGTISLHQRLAAGDKVHIAVTDTGPGLTADEIDRVFLPFERLDTDQHGIEGTGIGLPLALSLTEAMNGVLDVVSTPGAGSTFTVQLPVDGDNRPAAALPSAVRHLDSAGTADGLTGLVVLSIEDNRDNRQVLERTFRLWPTSTLHTAENGTIGFDLARRYRPDLILLDLHLPDLSGEEVFARLRAEPALAATPIIVLSADATPGTVRRLLARGAAAYLTKPLDLLELQEVILSTMARHTAGTHAMKDLGPARPVR